MCQYGCASLKQLHWDIWNTVVDSNPALLFDEMVLPDCLVTQLFDKLSDLVKDTSAIDVLMDEDEDVWYVHPHHDRLFKHLQALHHDFTCMQAETRCVVNEKCKAITEAKKLANLDQ